MIINHIANSLSDTVFLLIIYSNAPAAAKLNRKIKNDAVSEKISHHSFLSPLYKLHHALLRNPPPVPDLKSLNLSRMQQIQHHILANLQERTALTERHNLGYISVHCKNLLY